MKRKSGFLMRNIAGAHIIVPIGERVVDFKGMMTLNDTGSYLWDCLSEEISYDRLLQKILDDYDIDEAMARKDLEEFLKAARVAGVLEE